MKFNVLYKLIILLFFLMRASPAFAQDKIVKINNDTIRAKVVKITSDKIVYRNPGRQYGRLPEIHKNSVKEIIYANGSKLRIIYNLYEISADLLVQERFHVFKADFASPFLNHITLGYESRIKTGLNLELKAGIIGPGFSSQLQEAEGFLVKAGVKFVMCGYSYMKGQKYIHPMKGSYLKPEILFSQFSTIKDQKNITYNNFAMDILLGKQFIPGDKISLEFFGGFGFGIQSSSYQQLSQYDKKNTDFNYVYSHIFFGKELPIVLSGGLTVGIVF